MSKVSVIISVFNRVEFLEKCLLSLSRQSYLPDEVIITDDGSTTDVIGPVQDLIRRLDAEVHFVTQPHDGFRLARCRNNGVRVAFGDYLIFLDQDIIGTEDFIRTFVHHRREKRFCVSYPVRLTEEQTDRCRPRVIEEFDFSGIVAPKQIAKIHSQYRKDEFYRILHELALRKMGPKLRGGVAAINREDFEKVNGYDEAYRGWGNEDDDLGRRLYQARIAGRNPFFHDYPLHLWHPPYHEDGHRKNQEYYQQRIDAIRKGQYTCRVGLIHPDGLGDDGSVTHRRLK
jgi:GT2 family glycosyltransferase